MKMNKQVDFSLEFEQEVRTALAVPEVDTRYLAALREQVLKNRPAVERKSHGRFLQWQPVWDRFRCGHCVGPCCDLVCRTAACFGCSARRAWLYSSVGFVNKESALALRDPIEQVQNGQTFQVEQILASQKETVLVVRIQGVPSLPGCWLESGYFSSNSGRQDIHSRRFWYRKYWIPVNTWECSRWLP
jgi:hypothetical protein